MSRTLDALTLPQAAPLRAFVYARASRDPKRRGRSVDDQMTENRRECEHRNWTIAGEFKDLDRSASRHARRVRDDYEAMVEGVRAGQCDVLVTWESSRFQRDLDVYVKLRKLCEEARVLWCYNGRVYDMSDRADRRTTAFDAIQAEDEAEGIRDRILRTVRLNAERGGPHGRIPYGYTRQYDAKTGDLIAQIPDPVEAPIIREIFEKIAAGRSAYSIAAELNRRDVKTRQGYAWSGESVVMIVKNKVTYLGKRSHRGEVVGDASWDGIVEPETYYSAQQILSNPARRTSRDKSVKHLLSGIARCGLPECGRHLYVLKNRGYLTYTCKPSPHVACNETRLDAYVEEAVVEWLGSGRAVEAFRARDASAATADNLAEIDRLTAELQEARQLVVARRLSVASLAALEGGILPQIDSLREQVRRESVPSVVRDLIGASDADARWNALLIEERRAALRAIVTVTVNRGRPGVRRIEPGRVELLFLGDTDGA
jgi:DNA invertase Pin-like site-specific DNA recombinase